MVGIGHEAQFASLAAESASILLLDGGEDPAARNGCSVSVGGITDNRGNQFAVAKLLTTKWPLSAFLAEVAVQLESRGMMLEIAWVPRETNSEAGAITNGDVAWLDPANEIRQNLESTRFMVLREVLAIGADFLQGLDATNLEGEDGRLPNRDLLKVRDPWD